MTTTAPAAQLTRLEALRATASAYPTEPYVVAVGTMVREMLLVGRAENHLYVLDSMGLPPAIGLGLCLGLAESAHEKVVVIEGDGGMLMGLSTLATIGLLQPRQLLLVVLDNGVYAATGDQPTAASAVDFCAAARSCGFKGTWSVATAGELQLALAAARREPGPALLHVRIKAENAPGSYFLPDPVELTLGFQRYLTGK
ncbi:MAG: phosphonopyruvate decarboxylase [Dehalococcoidia bacterium]|nr:phosphonopyruvate decarboxylase [Dehalococcoidia bacterium]